MTGCGARAAAPSTARAHEPEPPALLELVADGAELVLRARVEAIARSPYFAMVAGRLREARDPAARAESEWLVDLARRTNDLVAALWLTPEDTLETLILLRGCYREEDVRQITAGEGGLREERRPGVRVFVRGDRAVAFVGARTILLGDARQVRAAIARLEARVAPRSAEDAVAALRSMARRSASALMVFVRVSERVARLLDEWAVSRGAGGLRSLALEADLEAGLRVRFELATESAAAATELLPVVAGHVEALGDTAVAEVLGLASSLRGARAESVGASVVARATVDDESFRAAIAAARELAIELARPPPGAEPVLP